MEESFAAHMRSNGSLDISFNTYISQMQSIVGRDISVNVQRSVSRLKSFFMTLIGGADHEDRLPMKKSRNNLYHPMNWSNGLRSKESELEFRLYIGKVLYPDYPITSQSFFYNLSSGFWFIG